MKEEDDDKHVPGLHVTKASRDCDDTDSLHFVVWHTSGPALQNVSVCLKKQLNFCVCESCRTPHLKPQAHHNGNYSAIFSASEQTQCARVVCYSEWVTVALHSVFWICNHRSSVLTALFGALSYPHSHDWVCAERYGNKVFLQLLARYLDPPTPVIKRRKKTNRNTCIIARRNVLPS